MPLDSWARRSGLRIARGTEALLRPHLPIHREQSHPLHACVMCQVDYIGHVLEVNVIVSAHEGYFFRALQVDFREPRFQIAPAHIVPD